MSFKYIWVFIYNALKIKYKTEYGKYLTFSEKYLCKHYKVRQTM